MTYNEIIREQGLKALPTFTSEMVSSLPDQTADLLNKSIAQLQAVIALLSDYIDYIDFVDDRVELYG